MPKSPALRKASQIYLTIVPPLAFVLAFAVGHVSYYIYLPIWIIHACIMITSAWILGAHMVRSQDPIPKFNAVIAIFLLLPWLFISIFAGMGPPPPTMAGWVNTVTEQQIRYLVILVAGGIFLAIGLTLLKEKLRQTGELIYSNIGAAAVRILTPLYIMNMIFWGYFLSESFKIFVATNNTIRPDWYKIMNGFFYVVSVVELALTYLATAAFARSLKATGTFKPIPCNLYIIFSFFGFACCLIPSYASGPLGIIGYVSSIPAVPFIMPYLIGINLLKKASPR